MKKKQRSNHFFINSKWMLTEIPYNITYWIGNFEGAIMIRLCPCNDKLNITKNHASLLQSICGNENIIIAHAEYNLGPAGIDTTQYICWALNNHLLYTSTYIQVSKDEAKNQSPTSTTRSSNGHVITEECWVLQYQNKNTFSTTFRIIATICLETSTC